MVMVMLLLLLLMMMIIIIMYIIVCTHTYIYMHICAHMLTKLLYVYSLSYCLRTYIYVGWVGQSLPHDFASWHWSGSPSNWPGSVAAWHCDSPQSRKTQVWCPTNCHLFLIYHGVSPHFVGSFPSLLLDEYGIVSSCHAIHLPCHPSCHA